MLRRAHSTDIIQGPFQLNSDSLQPSSVVATSSNALATGSVLATSSFALASSSVFATSSNALATSSVLATSSHALVTNSDGLQQIVTVGQLFHTKVGWVTQCPQ